MFLDQIDWNNPKYSRYNLRRLGKLNQVQLDAFFEDDSIDFPAFTEAELKELCEKVPCRVELFHSNVCYGVEKSWPKRIFNRATFKDLAPWQKQRLYCKMERNAVYLYNRYVDENRLKKRRKNHSNRALAPYYEERYLRNCYNRIKALGDFELNMSDSESSLITVINTQNVESISSLRYGRTRSTVNQQRSKSSSYRSKSNSSIYSDSSAPLQKSNQIIYEHSSVEEKDSENDDQYLSANEGEFSQGRRSNQSGILSPISPNDLKSDTSSPFVTPQKTIHDITPIITPNIEQLRQLRSNLFRVDSDDDVAVDQSISMVIESEKRVEISRQKYPIHETKKYNDTSITERNSIENIGSNSDHSSVDELLHRFDERFNDLLSESSVTSSIQNSIDDVESLRLTSTPRIDSNEFVIINSYDAKMLRKSRNANSKLSSTPLSNSYSLRNKISSLSKSYSLRHRKNTIT